MVLVASVGPGAVGFVHDRHPWSSAFLYTAGAVTHVVNPPEGLLTEPGQAIRIAISLLGPVLLGLALLGPAVSSQGLTLHHGCGSKAPICCHNPTRPVPRPGLSQAHATLEVAVFAARANA